MLAQVGRLALTYSLTGMKLVLSFFPIVGGPPRRTPDQDGGTDEWGK